MCAISSAPMADGLKPVYWLQNPEIWSTCASYVWGKLMFSINSIFRTLWQKGKLLVLSNFLCYQTCLLVTKPWVLKHVHMLHMYEGNSCVPWILFLERCDKRRNCSFWAISSVTEIGRVIQIIKWKFSSVR